MISKKISKQAAELYQAGMSVDAVAAELDVAYRTARKAIKSTGTELRNSSERLVGRTRPHRKAKG
jgi:transposase